MPGGSETSLAQLFDSNSYFRSQLAWYCQSTEPRKRKPRVVATAQGSRTTESRMVEAHPIRHGIGSAREREAEPEMEGAVDAISNFYTTVVILDDKGRRHDIDLTLMDGGATLDLIPARLVARLNLKTRRIRGLMMRTATDELLEIKHAAPCGLGSKLRMCGVASYAMRIQRTRHTISYYHDAGFIRCGRSAIIGCKHT